MDEYNHGCKTTHSSDVLSRLKHQLCKQLSTHYNTNYKDETNITYTHSSPDTTTKVKFDIKKEGLLSYNTAWGLREVPAESL